MENSELESFRISHEIRNYSLFTAYIKQQFYNIYHRSFNTRRICYITMKTFGRDREHVSET